MVSKNLISVAELAKSARHPDLLILDCSWFLPASGRNAALEYEQKRIPGAAFFDIDRLCDSDSELPHMLPNVVDFESAMVGLGAKHCSDIVVYDSLGLFSAARVWWMLKVFGHEKVRVLDGGMPAWIESGAAVNTGASEELGLSPSPLNKGKRFNSRLNETFLATKDVLKENCLTNEYLVLDARPELRFKGQAPEPREGLASGHMPNSKSLPFACLLENGKLKSVESLKVVLGRYGIGCESDVRPIITTCGSGVTAAIVTLALCESGLGMHKLYDGGWSEWAALPDVTILQDE